MDLPLPDSLPARGESAFLHGAYQSGVPVAITQSNNNSGLSGNVQRPNQASGDPGTSGSPEDRIDHRFNLAAWTQAAPYSLGNQPRTDTRVRTPFNEELGRFVPEEHADRHGDPRRRRKVHKVRWRHVFARLIPPWIGLGRPYFGYYLITAGRR